MPDTLPPLATIDQLNARLVTQVDNEDLRALAALEDASAEVRHAASRTWVDDEGELEGVPAIAVRITLRLAKDIYENPYGYRSEQIGEYANQRFAGGMLTPAEAAQLEKLSGDLLSVEMELPYKPSSTAQPILDDYRRNEALWP